MAAPKTKAAGAAPTEVKGTAPPATVSKARTYTAVGISAVGQGYEVFTIEVPEDFVGLKILSARLPRENAYVRAETELRKAYAAALRKPTARAS